MMTDEQKRINRAIRRVKMIHGSDKEKNSSRIRSNRKKLEYDLSPQRKKVFYQSREWNILKEWLYKRCKYSCVCCRTRERVSLHVDHIFPISKSPNLALYFKNIQYLCSKCNLVKSNHTNKKFTAYTRLGHAKSFTPSDTEIREMREKWINFFPPISANYKENNNISDLVIMENFFA